MPSPFPGMDPYLEGSPWTSFHFELGSEIVRRLAPQIRPRYVALPVERMVMETSGGISITATPIYPDANVVETGAARSEIASVGVMDAPVQLPTVIPRPVPHVSVEIRDVMQRQLVTAIEILSPTNKRAPGREEYLTKRGSILRSDAHLVEIDLLHQGARVPIEGTLPPAPYYLLIHRRQVRPLADVWPVSIRGPLPTIPIPLLPGDDDVSLDLQTTFTAVYDLIGYDLLLDYRQPPEIALPEDEAGWMNDRLKAAGLR